jgi:hypothetical protein
VRAQRKAGYDLLKIHPGIQRDVFEALDRTAREEASGTPGTCRSTSGLERALELRYWTIDHIDGYIEAMSKNPQTSQFFGVNLVNELDESRLPALVETTKAAGHLDGADAGALRQPDERRDRPRRWRSGPRCSM